MLDVVGLGTIATAFFVAAASPGPATLAVAAVSMRAGRSDGLRFGMGLSVGLAFWGLLAATGLGAVLQTSSLALSSLKVLGGAYLLWLAFNASRSAVLQRGQVVQEISGRGGHFTRGLLLNLSNPKAIFAWMATLALGLGGDSDIGQVGTATVLCTCLGFMIYASYAMIFSTKGAMSLYKKLRRWIDAATAGVFAVLGLGLIRSALVRP